MRALTVKLIFLLSSIIIGSSYSLAASVTQVKGTKVLITLDGMSASVGSEVYVLDSSDKKVGLLVIRQVKGNKALADITKGRAIEGGKIIAKTAGGGSSSPSSSQSSAKGSFQKKGRNEGGILAGLGMNSLSLTVQNAALQKEDVILKDMSYSLKGFYDYNMMPELTIRAAAGLETFSAKGSTVASICDGGTTCSVSFNYLALEGSAHYNFMTGKTKAWVGLGYSFLLQMSKANNIPNLSSESSTNQMILVSGGADFWTGSSSFIPVVVEYGMFPGSSNVSASAIYVRAGYGFTF
jgi:hypothetical protein